MGACECGAAGSCIDDWHEALAEEQADPAMYIWHAPLVCAFVLQHRSRMLSQSADGQFRMLQFYDDQGIEATNQFARHQIARNKRSGTGDDMEPLAPYAALPSAGHHRAPIAGIEFGDIEHQHLFGARGGLVEQMPQHSFPQWNIRSQDLCDPVPAQCLAGVRRCRPGPQTHQRIPEADSDPAARRRPDR